MMTMMKVEMIPVAVQRNRQLKRKITKRERKKLFHVQIYRIE